MVSFGRADGERADPFAIFKKPLKRTKTIVPDEMSRIRRFFTGKSRHFNFIVAHCALSLWPPPKRGSHTSRGTCSLTFASQTSGS
jgi:hypothetical protein